MQMLDGLATVLAAVIDDAVAVRKTLALCDLCNCLKALADKRGIILVYLVRAADMLLGKDQNVHRRLWVYITERKNVFVLIHFRRGDLPRYYLAE